MEYCDRIGLVDLVKMVRSREQPSDMKRSHTAPACVALALSFAITGAGGALAQQVQTPAGNSPFKLAQVKLAQTQSEPARETPAMAAARAAFDTLPEATRREIQDALVWTGHYKGGVDGGFGRMTHAAIQGWLAQQNSANAGAATLSPADITALKSEAARLRAHVAFGKVRDPRSGVVIGVPGKIFTRHATTPGGQRHETADRSASIETFRVSDLDGGLKTLFEAYTAPVAGRRVTYRVLRSDFFVVATETQSRASYTRVALQTPAVDSGQTRVSAPVMGGFTMSWPKGQKARYETLSLAVANSFEPFAASAAGAAKTAGATPGLQKPASLQPPVLAPRIAGSAIAFAQDRYIAILPDGVCPAARVGLRPAQILKHDPRTGLALIDTNGAKARRLQLPRGEARAGEPAVIIYAQGTAAAPQIAVTAGNMGAVAPLRLQAAVPINADGGVIVSRHGEFLGLVATAPPALRKLASAPDAIAIPQASRAMVPASAVFDFLTTAGLEFLPAQPSKSDQSAGAIAAATTGSIFPLICTLP